MNRFPRLYPILDSPTLGKRGCEDWSMVARGMLAGGAAILQLRHKGAWTPEVLERTRQIAGECERAGAQFVLNDRADIALLTGAGLHVGQDDLAPRDCRNIIGPAAVLGFSTHNAAQLQAAAEEPVDYVAFGPIFATASKKNPDPVCGVAALPRGLSKPLVAIGGITRATARLVFDAGADSIALISDLLPEVLTESQIRMRMEEWQRLTRQ